MTNGTIFTDFIFLSFSVPQWSHKPLSQFFTLLYFFIVNGNILIIILVKSEIKLHTPMYFFIANFSFLEIWYTTVTVPKMIRDLVDDDTSISFVGCIIQCYCFMICGANEHCLLAVLSFDRFTAICYPLQYMTIMKPEICIKMICGAWLISFVLPISTAVSLFKATYCDVNIDHFFCDISPLLQISCTGNNRETAEVFYTLSTLLIAVCFLMICVSYSFILYSVIRIKSQQGRHQAFLTCASHFTVVIIFYSSCSFMYIRPSPYKFFHADKFVALAYILVAPVLNPMIYTLRNKAIRTAIRNKKINIKT